MSNGRRCLLADYLGARVPPPPRHLNRKRILNASLLPHIVIRKNFTSTVYLGLEVTAGTPGGQRRRTTALERSAIGELAAFVTGKTTNGTNSADT